MTFSLKFFKMTKKLYSTPEDLASASQMIKEGGLVAFPTETVYGIGSLLYDKKAIEKLYHIKGRPAHKPFTVHIYDYHQIKELASHIPNTFYDLAKAFFPGPLTIVVPKHPHIPSCYLGGGDTIGIRMPQNELALTFLRLTGDPVVATSANLSSMPPATSADELLKTFDGMIAAVLDGGPTTLQIHSTVVTFDTKERIRILREGALSKTMLEKVCPIC
jgi:L-threonylcarbamoyladenylate synthase